MHNSLWPITMTLWGDSGLVRSVLCHNTDSELHYDLVTCIPKGILATVRTFGGVSIFPLPSLADVLSPGFSMVPTCLIRASPIHLAFTDADHPIPHLLLTTTSHGQLGCINTDTREWTRVMPGMEDAHILIMATRGPLLVGSYNITDGNIGVWRFADGAWIPLWSRPAAMYGGILANIVFANIYLSAKQGVAHLRPGDCQAADNMVEVDMCTGELALIPAFSLNNSSHVLYVKETGAFRAGWIICRWRGDWWDWDENAPVDYAVDGDRVMITTSARRMITSGVHVPGLGLVCSEFNHLIVWSHPDDVAMEKMSVTRTAWMGIVARAIMAE